MIELFLILRKNCFVADDEEITSLLSKEWNLHVFIQELIQALLPRKCFGGYNNEFSKEIMVNISLVFGCSYIKLSYIHSSILLKFNFWNNYSCVKVYVACSLSIYFNKVIQYN